MNATLASYRGARCTMCDTLLKPTNKDEVMVCPAGNVYFTVRPKKDKGKLVMKTILTLNGKMEVPVIVVKGGKGHPTVKEI